ncbi:MAG: hypothetical protein WCD43_19480, partial [Candidatus Acidiferrales bacterium]
GTTSFVKAQIAALKAQASSKAVGAEKVPATPAAATASGAPDAAAQPSPNAIGAQDTTMDALKKLLQQMSEMNARLAKIESQLATPKAVIEK